MKDTIASAQPMLTFFFLLLPDKCTTRWTGSRSFSISLKWMIFNGFATVCSRPHTFTYIINHCRYRQQQHTARANSLISFCKRLTTFTHTFTYFHLCLHILTNMHEYLCVCFYFRLVYYSHASALNLCIRATKSMHVY